MDIYLGIDVGTTAIKVLALDAAGRVLTLASRECRYSTPAPGWAEQDAEDWWRLVCEAVREVTGQLREPVAALALSTQGDTMVPLDTAGRPLSPAITWMDNRTLDQTAAMRQEEELWFAITGSSPAPYAAATSLLWWQQHLPRVFATARRFALVTDFLTGRLTGRYLLDAPNASRTMIYDIRRRAWSPELLKRVGVTQERLAEAAESGTIVGPVRAEVAADLGLSPDTQVVLGGHDQTCAAVGCGVIRPGSLMLSCGTAWVVLAATEKPMWDEHRGLQGYCHAVPGGYAALGSFAGGNLLRWFRDTFWHDGQTGDGAYEAITQEAAQALSDRRPPLIFLSHFYGAPGQFRCPEARGAWAGLTLQHTRGDLSLALLNGVALQTAWTVQNLARQGVATDDIRMIGGGARSRFWAQLVADALHIPIRLPAITEAAAYGAALIAATAAGAFPSLEAASAHVSIRDCINPAQPADQAQSAHREALLAALVPLWQDLQRLTG